jgi:DNA-binding FrmR family transcriptional regulator
MQADKTEITKLLKTVSGQLDGIQKMVDGDRYCIDISNQLLSAISILKKANMQIIRAHLTHCVHDALIDGGGEEKVDEMLNILEKMTK